MRKLARDARNAGRITIVRSEAAKIPCENLSIGRAAEAALSSFHQRRE